VTGSQPVPLDEVVLEEDPGAAAQTPRLAAAGSAGLQPALALLLPLVACALGRMARPGA
jgi:hypothetical protein